jgi:elongation factor Ts
MELREATGLGMMACKKALTEAGGNIEKAMEDLRKQGQATAAKRAGRAAKEGIISVVLHDDAAIVYEVNSETDFVSRSDDFVKFVTDLGEELSAERPAHIDAARVLVPAQFGGQSVEAKVTELIG